MNINLKALMKVSNKPEPDNIKENDDYNHYSMSKFEKIKYILLCAIFIFLVSFVFYRSYTFSAILLPISLLYPKYKLKDLINKQKSELNLQFKDMLYSLSSSLSAGKSVESSFKEVLKDLAIQYPDPNTNIIKEVEKIVSKIEMNETIESALSDFAKRSHLEDVHNFVDVFQTCKRAGGNIVEIIKNTSNIINDKIEIKQEIDTMLSQRRFEQKIMNVIPILMIILLSWSAYDYMMPVFTTIVGKLAMTVSALLLVLAYFISSKIMNIDI